MVFRTRVKVPPFTRLAGEMLTFPAYLSRSDLVVATEQPIDQAVTDLEAVVTRYGSGLLPEEARDAEIPLLQEGGLVTIVPAPE